MMKRVFHAAALVLVSSGCGDPREPIPEQADATVETDSETGVPSDVTAGIDASDIREPADISEDSADVSETDAGDLPDAPSAQDTADTTDMPDTGDVSEPPDATDLADAIDDATELHDASDDSDVMDVADGSDGAEPDAPLTDTESPFDATDVLAPSDVTDADGFSDGDTVDVEDASDAAEDCDATGTCPTPCGETSCAAGLVCRDETCFEIGPPAVCDYEPSPDWSFVRAATPGPRESRENQFSEAQVLSGASAGVCCFDIDGDGSVDNQFASVNTLGGALIAITTLDTFNLSIDSGRNLMLVEFRDGLDAFGNPARLHFHSGSADLDNNGTPDTTPAEWDAGLGEFVVSPAFYVDGAPMQINDGVFDSVTGMFSGSAASATASLVVELEPSGLDFPPFPVVMHDVRLEGELMPENPRRSLDRTMVGRSWGGIRMGGYIELDQIFAEIDRFVSACTCATGSADGLPARLCYGDSETGPNSCDDVTTRYKVACSDRSYDLRACTADTDSFCRQSLNLFCGVGMTALSSLALADIDVDGDGVNDAMSFGFWLTLREASVLPVSAVDGVCE